jgi:hypothetical protein
VGERRAFKRGRSLLHAGAVVAQRFKHGLDNLRRIEPSFVILLVLRRIMFLVPSGSRIVDFKASVHQSKRLPTSAHAR